MTWLTARHSHRFTIYLGRHEHLQKRHTNPSSNTSSPSVIIPGPSRPHRHLQLGTTHHIFVGSTAPTPHVIPGAIPPTILPNLNPLLETSSLARPSSHFFFFTVTGNPLLAENTITNDKAQTRMFISVSMPVRPLPP